MRRICILSSVCLVLLSCGQGTARTSVPEAAGTVRQSAPEGYCADATYLYAEKDGEELYMDIYESAVAEEELPTLIYLFGGGFIRGSRNEDYLMPFFSALNDRGYRVVSIDYRLGLKGKGKVGLSTVDNLDKAIHLVVEDLFSATCFLADNREELGIDTDNLVIMGSSAGAISVLQSEYEICNGTDCASVLPDGFNYRGVISLAGAVLSRNGALRYATAPAPMLLFHGTADDVVDYKQIRFFKLGWYGSDTIAKVCSRNGYNYCIYRFKDARHEIADSGLENIGIIDGFIRVNILQGQHRIVDAMVSDPRIEVSTLTLDELYQ
ncbi:MAG: alpha/beta hydrolase [Candidatus Cryptobacteroides sp.]